MPAAGCALTANLDFHTFRMRTQAGVARQKQGAIAAACARRWEEDQTFKDVRVNIIEAADVVDGAWYLIIKGDYTGRVTGNVYDLTIPTQPEPVELTPTWEKCRLPAANETVSESNSRKVRARASRRRRRRVMTRCCRCRSLVGVRTAQRLSPTLHRWRVGHGVCGTQLRQLLLEFKQQRATGNRDPDLLRTLRSHHFPGLPDINTTTASPELRERLDKIAQTWRQINVLRKELTDRKAAREDEGGGARGAGEGPGPHAENDGAERIDIGDAAVVGQSANIAWRPLDTAHAR